MHVILLALGIVVTVAGGAMAGFGILNNGFEVGNALITAGTIAVVGGLIIVALAAVVRELRAARMPQTRAPLRAAAVAPPTGPAPPARDAAPEVPPPRAPAGEVADLSQVLAEPPADAPAAAPADAPPAAAPSPAVPPALDPFAPARADPQRKAAARERGFDSVWAPDPAKAGSPAPRRAPEPSGESETVAIRPTREPQAVTVLKSGVIEGMAYTLYSDGSIEADLPQGMARFASIDALRRHLAGQG